MIRLSRVIRVIIVIGTKFASVVRVERVIRVTTKRVCRVFKVIGLCRMTTVLRVVRGC